MLATSAAAAAAFSTLSAWAGGQIQVDAGADFAQDLSISAQLVGDASGRRPTDFWMGDGDLDNEDRFVCYDDVLGFRQSGMLVETTTQLSAGWPSDVVEIEGVFYGMETGNRFLWQMSDYTQGTVTKVGATHTWPWVTCMAYDEGNDVLYAVDGSQKRLLIVDYTTGAVTPTGAYLTASGPYYFIKGLAFDDATGLLFAIEDNTESLITIDPNDNAQTSFVMSTPSGSDLYDELEFYAGVLYASFKYWDAANGWWTSTVRRIDYQNGEIYDVGPLVPKMSPHTLLIRSFPEEVHWSLVSGPGSVTFTTPHALATDATFSAPGSYVLDLTVECNPPVSDQIQVEVYALDCNANLVDDSLDIATSASQDMNANGVPDECEVIVYCAAKTNSLGCTPQIGFTGTVPSLSDSNPFLITATSVLNQRNGLMFYGYDSLALSPFNGGTLCVKAPLRRLPIQAAGGTLPPQEDCSGSYSFDFNAHLQTGIDAVIVPGTQVNAQWWSRDPNHGDGTGIGLTNAIQFHVAN